MEQSVPLKTNTKKKEREKGGKFKTAKKVPTRKERRLKPWCNMLSKIVDSNEKREIRECLFKTGHNSHKTKDGKVLISCTKGSDSHMIEHFKHCHMEDIRDIVAKYENGMDVSDDCTKALEEDAKKFGKSTTNITKFLNRCVKSPARSHRDAHWCLVIAKTGFSFNAACSDTVNDFFVTHAGFPVTNRETMSGPVLTGTHDIVFEHVQNTVQQDADSAAGTSDTWKGPCMDSFICITLHWINRDWKFRRATVGVLSITGSHTAAKLESVISKKVADFAPKLTLTAMVTDNGKDMKKASENLFSTNEKGKGDTTKRNRSCFAHDLQLAVKDVINEQTYDEHICSSRSIIITIRKSGVLTEKLKKITSN